MTQELSTTEAKRMKPKKLLKWQREYLEEIRKLSNEDVLAEYSYYHSGDSYDGCRTARGEWKYDQISDLLKYRLNNVGFYSDTLYSEMGEFTKAAFSDAGSVEHLLKLKNEADEAIAAPHDSIEYADCLLCLFGAAYKAGIAYERLLSIARAKLEILKTCKWEKMPDGTYQHIE